MSASPSSARHPRDVVLIDGVRTPFAKAASKMRWVHPAELGRIALRELIARSGIDADAIEEVIVGNAGNPPDAVNIARVIALNAGVPQKASAFSVHRNCASALESLASGYERIRSGTLDVVAAGGTESMSQMPLLFSRAFVGAFERLGLAKTGGQRLGALGALFKADILQVLELMTTGPLQKSAHKPIISILEGLTDPFVGLNMGDTAEILAKEFHVTRTDQDAFALRSHQRAVAATKAGRLREEITPVFLAPKYDDSIVDDLGPRESQTLEQLGKLKPFFDRKTGTVTVGNACPITDGAAMALLMSREKASALGLKPMARIRSYAFAGLEPERMGLGPAYAVPLALKRAGLPFREMGVIELNEAFAAQVIACERAFASDLFAREKLGLGQAIGEIDPEKLNVNGGAIALGHPVGATGTRLVITAMKEMRRRGAQFGLATLCIGGGQGGAMIIENEA